MKIETGVMVMKDGKAWGENYYGWMAPEDAPIHDPKFCTKPTDVTFPDSRHTKELMTGKIVAVERQTTVVILPTTPVAKEDTQC